jgi:hypothetical protein
MTRRLLTATLLVAACTLCAAQSPPAPADAGGAGAPASFSEAERALFVTNHLAGIRAPTAVRYSYRKSGTLEAGFEDKLTLTLARQADGSCCRARADFADAAHRLELPDVDNARGNPVILHFLERDVREMNRLTKGQAAYFRKRIRMAVFQGAAVHDTTVAYAGKQIKAREISVTPYVDDPLRGRFENLAGKQYVFTLSEAVPGGVYSIRSRVRAPTGGGDTTPLLQEELLIEGAQ